MDDDKHKYVIGVGFGSGKTIDTYTSKAFRRQIPKYRSKCIQAGSQEHYLFTSAFCWHWSEDWVTQQRLTFTASIKLVQLHCRHDYIFNNNLWIYVFDKYRKARLSLSNIIYCQDNGGKNVVRKCYVSIMHNRNKN